jgi:hypothetical protein
MLRTMVIFVHGFISDPSCWDPFIERLQKDDDFIGKGYLFTRFQYPTKFLEWDYENEIESVSQPQTSWFPCSSTTIYE